MAEKVSSFNGVKVFIASEKDIAEVKRNRFYIPFRLKNSGSVVFVARDSVSGRIMGYAAAEKMSGRNFLEIKRISTKRGFSGEGIGRKLLGRVQSYAIKNNLSLFVVSSSTAGAINFWKTKAKFRKVPHAEKVLGKDVSFFKKAKKVGRTRKPK